MALVICDGLIEEIGFGSYDQGERMLSFVKINGKRIKNVSCDDYTRSFIKVGAKVRLALVRRFFGTHTVYAIQLEDGEIIVKSKALPIVMVGMLGFALTLLMSPFFILILRATHSILISLIIFSLGGLGFAYLLLRNHFKARLVFGKPSS